MLAFGPIAGYPFASLADGTVVLGTVAESMTAASAPITALNRVGLLDEALSAAVAAIAHKDNHVALNSALTAHDSLAVVWRVLISAGITVSSAAAASLNKVAHAADTLLAMGLATSRKDAHAAIVSAMALNEMITGGWKVSAASSAAFTDALTLRLNAIGRLVDSATAHDSAKPSLHMVGIAHESLAVDDAIATTMNLLAKVDEQVVVYATIRLGDDEYVGWVVNEGAPSQYTNYPFNGFVEFPAGSKRYIGTARDGLYLLEGDDDDGDDIDTRIKTGLMDFGIGALKRMPIIYVAYAGGDRLVCKVVTVNPRSGAQEEAIYTAETVPGAALHNAPIHPGQGLVSRYWQFELSNVDGADFDLDELTFRPLILDRRI